MGLHGKGFRYRKNNISGSIKREYKCDVCGIVGPNRGKNRIRAFIVRDGGKGQFQGTITTMFCCPSHYSIGEERHKEYIWE